MKIFIPFFISIVLSGCLFDSRKEPVLSTDKDYYEFWRQYSPDSSMLLINYGIDLGATGYAQVGTAIMKSNDSIRNLRLVTLPNTFDKIAWIDNKTISAKFDTIPYIRRGEKSYYNDTLINGISVKISAYDHIEPNAKQVIEHCELSPSGQYELVAYRYMNDERNFNFLHISVIPAGKEVPKYGNYIIADRQSDYVLNGRWEKDNSLIFYSNSLYADMVKYYLVKNRLNIKYKVIIDDKTFSRKYLWLK